MIARATSNSISENPRRDGLVTVIAFPFLLISGICAETTSDE